MVRINSVALSTGKMGSSISAAELGRHAEKVLQSPGFVRSPRMRRFLAFLVEELLAGRSDQLKEYTIALAVFDKPADFDPGTSAVIRVEAGRLRRLLAQYRLGAGREDSLALDIPKGSYVPVFRHVADEAAAESDEPGDSAEVGGAEVGTAEEQRLVTVLSCVIGDERPPIFPSRLGDFIASFDLFHRVCTSVAADHGGTVDGGASDRLIIYFGWPDALEDAAVRALNAALAILDRLRAELGDRAVGVRIGIATSEAVIRPSGTSGQDSRPTVIGQAPLLAATMLRQAPFDGILVSETTRRLGGATFDFVPAAALEGQERAAGMAWRLLGERSCATRFRAQHHGNASRIVGRQEEIALLARRWRLSGAGEGQVVFIVGEAGIGKSKLAEAALENFAGKGLPLRIQCSSHHANSTLYPVIEFLKQILAFQPGEVPIAARLPVFLSRFGLDEPINRALLSALLSCPAGDALGHLSASQRKDLTHQLLTGLVLARAGRRPAVLLVEDIHWADPSTLELLQQIVATAADNRMMLVLTSRHGHYPGLSHHNNVTSLQLARLPRGECNSLIDAMAGTALLSSSDRARVLEKAEGIPLFLEELTKLLLGADGPPSDQSLIPDSLSDLLASQYSRLGGARAIAQVAAVIGREFTREMLRAAVGGKEEEVDIALDRLSAAGILIRQAGGTPQFQFRHALLRDAAYSSILDDKRRALHLRVGAMLVDSFPLVASKHPEIVAHHLSEARMFGDAIDHWIKAGTLAAGRYALAEAISDYRQALAAFAELSDTARNRARKLELLISLGLVVRSANGYGDLELAAIYEQARTLAAELGDRRCLADAVYGLWTHAAGRGLWPSAGALAAEFEALTRDSEDSQLEVEAFRLMGASAAFRGEFAVALSHFDHALGVYDPRIHGPNFGFDAGAAAAAYLAWVHWHLGNDAEAAAAADRALATAEAKNHPSTLAMVLSWLIFYRVCARDVEAILDLNGRLQVMCAERECRYWQPFGSACAEWAEYHRDRDPRRLERLIAFSAAFNERYFTSCLLLLGADICLQEGQLDRGMELARSALRFVKEHEERIWESECHRLIAELHLRMPEGGGLGTARQALARACRIAHRQGAASLKARAADRLAALDEAEPNRPHLAAPPAPARTLH